LKKNKSSKNWLNKQKSDIYVRKSKTEGYRSRAAYKLEEINNKFNILKNGMKIIDLGAAPGGWSQFASKKFKNMKILSIDLKEIDPIDNIYLMKGDFTKENNQKKIEDYFDGKVDFVMSDMAVNTTGNKSIDSLVTGELSIEALSFSSKLLTKQGSFLSKVFMGTFFNEIVHIAKKKFKKVHIFKPPASRKNSKENFIICKYLR
tara:strand:+ start:201 stop:812 length:612 start_codon:yes stop_codon:yes gene_type:complete